jgi:hypothetical protein
MARNCDPRLAHTALLPTDADGHRPRKVTMTAALILFFLRRGAM